ncbi:hypothetical protein A3Q56_08363, partial [Intoshia linei]
LCISKYNQILKSLKEEFHRRFSDLRSTSNRFYLFTKPFSLQPDNVSVDYQLELIDFQSSELLRDRFYNMECTDCKSAHGQFLIDTGSTVNLIAIDMLDALCIPKPYIVSKTKLIAANGQSLIQYGTVDIIANGIMSTFFITDNLNILGFSDSIRHGFVIIPAIKSKPLYSISKYNVINEIAYVYPELKKVISKFEKIFSTVPGTLKNCYHRIELTDDKTE